MTRAAQTTMHHATTQKDWESNEKFKEQQKIGSSAFWQLTENVTKKAKESCPLWGENVSKDIYMVRNG